MTIFSTHPALRWAVPGVAVAAVIGAGATSGVIAASANTGLPARSAAQLLVDVQQARLDGLSGTVVERADLGLPDLPLSTGGNGGAGSSSLSSLVSGTHTMRVWVAGPDKARVALLGTLGESDVIRNGSNVWVWSSHDKSAEHFAIPAQAAKEMSAPNPAELPKTPQEAADLALKAIGPSTVVHTSGTAVVAGRSAYELVLKPRAASSLVAQVRIAIDGVKHVPLRVQVFSKKAADPAFEVAFSSVDFSRPDAAQFNFTAPPGTKVTQGKLGAGNLMPKPNAPHSPASSADRPTVVGTGWATVVVAKTQLPNAQMPGSAPGARMDMGQLGPVLQALPRVSGSWGSGRLLAGRLFSVLLTDDGRVAVGAVTPQALYAALGAK